jgi:hypothetical protein
VPPPDDAALRFVLKMALRNSHKLVKGLGAEIQVVRSPARVICAGRPMGRACRRDQQSGRHILVARAMTHRTPRDNLSWGTPGSERLTRRQGMLLRCRSRFDSFSRNKPERDPSPVFPAPPSGGICDGSHEPHWFVQPPVLDKCCC